MARLHCGCSYNIVKHIKTCMCTHTRLEFAWPNSIFFQRLHASSMQKTCCWISANITSQWSPHVTNCGCHHVINAPLELQPSASIRDHVLFATCRRHSLRHIPFVFDPFEIQRVFFQSFTGTAPWLLRLGHSAWMHLQWWCICLPDSNEKLHHKHPKAPKSTQKHPETRKWRVL